MFTFVGHHYNMVPLVLAKFPDCTGCLERVIALQCLSLLLGVRGVIYIVLL